MSQDLAKLWNFLKGKKTYLVSLAALIYGWGIQQGLWQHVVLVDAILASGGLASLRHSLSPSSGDSTAAPAPTAPISAVTKVAAIILLIGFSGLVIVGCASYQANAFNATQLAVDAATQATHGFNQYYLTATNGMSEADLLKLDKIRDSIYIADKNIAFAASVEERARLAYATNSSDTNKTALDIAVGVVGSQSSNVVWLINNWQLLEQP